QQNAEGGADHAGCEAPPGAENQGPDGAGKNKDGQQQHRAARGGAHGTLTDHEVLLSDGRMISLRNRLSRARERARWVEPPPGPALSYWTSARYAAPGRPSCASCGASRPA